MILRIMKLVLLAFFSFFVSSFLFSQDVKVIWGSSIEKSEKEIPVKIFPNSHLGFTIVKRITDEKNAISIDVLDSNNVLLFSNRATIQDAEILKIELVNGKITLFSVVHNNEKQTDDLSAYTLSSKGELSGTILIASLKSNGGYLASYKIAVSPDGKKVGVLCEKPYQKDKAEELVIKILDKDLKAILTQDYSCNLPSMKRKFNVPFINNKGSLYFVKRAFIKSNNKYFISLIKESGVEEHHDLKLKSMQIADVGCTFDNEGALIVSGFFSGYGVLNFEGVFNYKFIESTMATFKEESYFPESMITAFKTKKEISKLGNGLDNFHLKEVVVMPDNITYLVAEHLSTNRTDKETSQERKGLAIIKFNDKGEFLWASPVETNQIDNEFNGYWSSSILFGMNDSLIILYNQIGEELKNPEEVYGSNVLVGVKLCKIAANGVVDQKPIKGMFSSLPEGAILDTKIHLFINDKLKVIAENKERNKFYLGSLTFTGNK